MTRFLLPGLVLAVAYFVWRNPQGWAGLTKSLRPFVLLALALLYLGSPIDLIPDGLPAGFVDDLLVLLAAIYFGNRPIPGMKPPRRPAAEPRADRQRLDPYEVLGVPRGASREEITRGYRDQMKKYHPDRVAGLGEDLQKVAHEKSVEIRRAYESLTG